MSEPERSTEAGLPAPPPVPTDAAGSLFNRVSALIEQARQAVATYTNVALTLTFWRIGHLIDVEVLDQQRADYGKEILASLGRELATAYGKGYEDKNLYRMVQFARLFPDERIVASLGRELSWTHFKTLLPLKSSDARDYYAQQVATQRLT
ncbi:MAG: DUF1016 N-terminal domain-containing protein [Propionibacteriaceae bacterium]|jgi:hypothetical protein|nr:DUF1016 N-terminal domain-containing protein [Propionibacteriaceae bacterium]